MIRAMRKGEEGKVRELIAKLECEDQVLWRNQPKPLEECLARSANMRIGEEVVGKNVVLVAEEDHRLVGLCLCTVVDRGVDRQGELAEFYVEKEYRWRGIGKKLVSAAKQFFVEERVEVAFVWTHHGNTSAIELYKDAGFKEVTQVVMAFVPAGEGETEKRQRPFSNSDEEQN